MAHHHNISLLMSTLALTSDVVVPSFDSLDMYGPVEQWKELHELLVTDAASYTPCVCPVLIGNSHVEGWRNQRWGVPLTPPAQATNASGMLRDALGARWPLPLVLGIAGDTTRNVLWRLDHGELSSPMQADPGARFVLLIGTNDLAWKRSPGAVAAGVLALARLLLERARGRVLVCTLLPRGQETQSVNGSSIGRLTDLTNAALVAGVRALAPAHGARLGAVDCGAYLVAGGGNGRFAGYRLGKQLLSLEQARLVRLRANERPAIALYDDERKPLDLNDAGYGVLSRCIAVALEGMERANSTGA
jgi:hypothetical protein